MNTGVRCSGLTRAEAIVGVAAAGLVILTAGPVVGGAARASRANVCMLNLGTIAAATNRFAIDSRQMPPSYVYGAGPNGTQWNLQDQQVSNPNPANGYVHWSGMLTSGGYTQGSAVYQCPDVPSGGAPNTNPGPVAADWDAGQVNDVGSGPAPALPNDRQAKRLAYTANAALMPRNKLVAGSTPRHAVLVGVNGKRGPVTRGAGTGTGIGDESAGSSGPINDPSNTILMTEFGFLASGGWSTIANTTSGLLMKSHRPVTPFVGMSSGTDVFNEPNSPTIARFRYPTAGEIAPLSPGVLTSGNSELSAVGRHHAGGTAFFSFTDAHVELSTVEATVSGRRWGDRFYSISGNNAVRP